MKKIFILTGEPSGDKLASKVISKLQKNNPNIMIGSYPYYTDDGYGANIVCRAKNLNEL